MALRADAQDLHQASTVSFGSAPGHADAYFDAALTSTGTIAPSHGANDLAVLVHLDGGARQERNFNDFRLGERQLGIVKRSTLHGRHYNSLRSGATAYKPIRVLHCVCIIKAFSDDLAEERPRRGIPLDG